MVPLRNDIGIGIDAGFTRQNEDRASTTSRGEYGAVERRRGGEGERCRPGRSQAARGFVDAP
jgi:hypothetical protein